MTTKSRKRAPMKVSQMRERLRKLSGLYGELRQFIRQYLEDNPEVSLREINEVSGYGWGRLQVFMGGQSALNKGSSLQSMGEYIGCQPIVQEIENAIGPLTDRMIALGAESSEVFELVLDLMDAHRKQKYGLTQDQFAEAFEPYGSVVSGSLRFSKESYAQLRDSDLRATITRLLRERLDDKLQRIDATHRALKQEVIDELLELIQPYLNRYGSVPRVADALGMKQLLLTESAYGSATIEQIRKVKAIVADKIKGLEPKAEDKKQAESNQIETKARANEQAISPPEQATQLDDGELIPASLVPYAGETVNGQPFVLTAAAVREVETREVLDFVETLQRMMARTRAMINVASQLRDENVADIVRERLNQEVVEMYRSLKIFTSTHPNELTEIYDSERQIKSVQRATHGALKGKGA